MFSDRLKELRNVHNVSQKKLADALFVSQQSIAKWELDKSSPNPDMIVKIADFFNCSTDFLLGRTDDPRLEIKKAPPESGAEEYAKDKDAPELTIDEIKRLKAFLESHK